MQSNVIPLVDPVRRFILYTNAKCGGTSLKAWFFANLDLPRLAFDPVGLTRRFGTRFAWRYYTRGRRLTPRGDEIRDAERLRRMAAFYRRSFSGPHIDAGRTEEFFKFAVVRRPEERVVSAFIDKFCGEDRDKPFSRSVVAAAGRDGDITFDRFLSFLEGMDDATADPHWRRQVHVFGGRRIDAYVRLEHMAADFATLAPRIGGDPWGHLDFRLQTNPFVAAPLDPAELVGFPARPTADIVAWREARGAFPPKSAFLTPDTLARIRRIYAADYAMPPYAE